LPAALFRAAFFAGHWQNNHLELPFPQTVKTQKRALLQGFLISNRKFVSDLNQLE
jgi:hypothetical protein